MRTCLLECSSFPLFASVKCNVVVPLLCNLLVFITLHEHLMNVDAALEWGMALIMVGFYIYV